jgi:acylphosphatase
MQVLYSGHVQGVGFRYTAQQVASRFEVVGKVRNLSDGRVELIAEGSRAELDAFRQAIREAGMDHFIDREEVSWSQASNQFRGFQIGR